MFTVMDYLAGAVDFQSCFQGGTEWQQIVSSEETEAIKNTLSLPTSFLFYFTLCLRDTVCLKH